MEKICNIVVKRKKIYDVGSDLYCFVYQSRVGEHERLPQLYTDVLFSRIFRRIFTLTLIRGRYLPFFFFRSVFLSFVYFSFSLRKN